MIDPRICVGTASRAVLCMLALTAWRSEAAAHPHVFVEANLEIVRDAGGAVVELRHVWRFDELFSSTVMLDFDTNADGKLSVEELDEVSSVVTESVGENDFFTQVRLKAEAVEFQGPERIMVDYADGQLLMFFALKFEEPVAFGKETLRLSVADPTYYVAMDLVSEAAIQVSGQGTKCGVEIIRPDFDRLYASNQTRLTEEFFSDPAGVNLGDEWLTWIELQCS